MHPDTAWSGIPCWSIQSATQASLRMHSAARCSSAVGRNRKWLQPRMLEICSEMGRHVMGRYQKKPRLRNLQVCKGATCAHVECKQPKDLFSQYPLLLKPLDRPLAWSFKRYEGLLSPYQLVKLQPNQFATNGTFFLK